jgi:hypothetical protein
MYHHRSKPHISRGKQRENKNMPIVETNLGNLGKTKEDLGNLGAQTAKGLSSNTTEVAVSETLDSGSSGLKNPNQVTQIKTNKDTKIRKENRFID